jgi:hypothetical protein
VSYLIVRTEVRTFEWDELTAALARGGCPRDQDIAPEVCRQMLVADDRTTALRLARTLALTRPVRSGRQRIKVLRQEQIRVLVTSP